MTEWRIQYNTDTGQNDDYLIEWWEITNGAKYFTCHVQADAEWICKLLNESKVAP